MSKEYAISRRIENQLNAAGIYFGFPREENRFFPTEYPHVFNRRLLILPFIPTDAHLRTEDERKPLLYTPVIPIMMAHGVVDSDGRYRFRNGVLVEDAVRLYSAYASPEYGLNPLGAVIACQTEQDGDVRVRDDIGSLAHLIYPKSLARIIIPRDFMGDGSIPLIATSPSWHIPGNAPSGG
jgi:hypothetical protein